MYTDDLQEAVELANEFDTRKQDTLTPASALEVMWDTGRIRTHSLFSHDSEMSINAIRGMLRFFRGTKRNPLAPNIYGAAKYLANDCPTDLFAKNMNTWLKALGDKELLLRDYTDNGGTETVAVYSDRYKVADPSLVLEAVNEFMDDAGVDFPVKITVYPYDVYGKIIIPSLTDHIDEDGNGYVPYSAGVAFGTSGIGNRAHYVSRFVQRGPCDNSTVLYDGWKKRHTISGPEVKFFIASAMRDALALAGDTMERLHQAARRRLENPLDLINGIVKSRGLDEDAAAHLFAAAQTQGGPTTLGLSNAVTFYAQSIDNLWDRESMEILGGKILMADTMAELNHAVQYQPENVEQF